MTLIEGLAALAGLWLMAIGVVMVAWPLRALAMLKAAGSSPAIHFGEMAVRAGAGGLLMLAAPTSRLPAVIFALGAFLVVTAVVLSILPRRWHGRYSLWWARRIPPTAVRLLGPLAVLAGAGLVWVLV